MSRPIFNMQIRIEAINRCQTTTIGLVIECRLTLLRYRRLLGHHKLTTIHSTSNQDSMIILDITYLGQYLLLKDCQRLLFSDIQRRPSLHKHSHFLPRVSVVRGRLLLLSAGQWIRVSRIYQNIRGSVLHVSSSSNLITIWPSSLAAGLLCMPPAFLPG